MKMINHDASDSAPISHVRVKFTPADIAEVNISISQSSTVEDLKTAIASAIKMTADKYIRLIFNGKMLHPDESLLSSFNLPVEVFVHAVVATRRSSSSQGNPLPTNHSVNNGLPRRGLDVLTERPLSGRTNILSVEQVQAIRAYFREAISDFATQRVPRLPNESDIDYQYRCETEWMRAQDTRSEFQMNLNAIDFLAPSRSGLVFGIEEDGRESVAELGSYRDFFYGLVLGYLLGFMMIFCVWDRNLPHRQKLGILTGIMLQLLASMWTRGAHQNHGTNAHSNHQHMISNDGNQPEQPDGGEGGSGPSLRGSPSA